MVKLLGLSFSLSTTSSPSQDFGTLRFNFELHNKWNPVTRQIIECVFVETKQIVGCNSNVILQPALGIAAESKHRALAFYFSNMLQKYPICLCMALGFAKRMLSAHFQRILRPNKLKKRLLH